MSANILWGEGRLAGALQPILTVDNAPLLDVDDVPITTVIPDVILADLLDVDGDPILTVALSPIEVIASASVPPRFWQTADISSDGGVPFDFLFEANPFQPSEQGGENVFAWLYLTLSWSMAATLRVRCLVDGDASDVDFDGGSVQFVDSTFTLAQQGGSLQRLTQVFAVPLVRSLKDDQENEQSRYYLRGERFQFVVESVGALGVGELLLEGAELEYQGVRKAIYPGEVVTT